MDNDNNAHALPNNAPESAQARSLTPLSYLSAPVPDYASSLLSNLADHADDANTAFLRESLDAMSTAQLPRTSVDQSRDPRVGLSRRQRNVSLNRSDSPTHRDRLQRYLSHLYRIHNPPASTSAAYSNRTPSPHRQSIYDWAPAIAEPAADPLSQQASTSEAMQGSSERRENTSTMDTTLIPEPLEVEAGSGEHGLPSATARMLRYFMERERSGLSEEEERARGTGWYRPVSTTEAERVEHMAELVRQRDELMAQSAELTARWHNSAPAGNHSTHAPTYGSSHRRTGASIALLENAVKYLAALQQCDSVDEGFAAAMEHDLTTKELYISKHDEFMLELSELDPPHTSTWLQAGTVFEGHQYATTTILSRARDIVRATTTEQINPYYRPTNSNEISVRHHRPAVRHHRASPLHASTPTTSPPIDTSKSNLDHWPVRMTIHNVDHHNMTLQGTMEAYDVPRPSALLIQDFRHESLKSGKDKDPITTYVEGHIIDFATYTFLTTNPEATDNTTSAAAEAAIFPPATATKDAENWHRLPPFNEGSKDDMAQLILSKDRLAALNADYLFMRWKERCFVHDKHDKCSERERRSDHDKGHGLSISGFYYISMRRSDGLIEGVYYDAQSTPYQHLRLKVTSTTWPSWQFR